MPGSGYRPIWSVKGGSIDLSSPVVMGIVNVTPDSFSDGGLHEGASAIRHGLALAEAGAAVVDVGGESTRPGADPVSSHEEIRRVLAVVEALGARGIVVSIDTTKADVAAAALDAGAVIVNDVTGLRTPEMRRVVADHGAGAVVMHMQGEPRTMQDDPTYGDVVTEVISFLSDRLAAAHADGIPPGALVADPGIGFGKTVDHNLQLIAGLDRFSELGVPIMVGASRKRFLGTLLDIPSPSDRDRATAILTALLVERGAAIVRVHDVGGSREAVELVRAIVTVHEGTV